MMPLCVLFQARRYEDSGDTLVIVMGPVHEPRNVEEEQEYLGSLVRSSFQN
jgi:hypothetical protein